MRPRPWSVLVTLCVLPVAALAGPAGAQAERPPRPGPAEAGPAAAAGRDAGRPQGPTVAAATLGPQQFVSARVFATQYNPNTPGSVEVAVPDKCAKFAALRLTAALSQANCSPGYSLGLDYRVVVTRDSGQSSVIPVKDTGPWNTDDNYWDFGPGAPRPRRLFADLAPGLPEAQAAFYNGYHSSPNCVTLSGQPSGHAGGSDQFGRCVLNPAGIDLSVAAAAQLGISGNEWVTVSFLWEPVRYALASVNSSKVADIYRASRDDGAPAIQWPWNGGANQQWHFEAVVPNTWRIVSVNSGKVLDVFRALKDDGAAVIQWPWNGGANQQWRFEPVGENVFRIVSVNSGKVLDVYGASLLDGARLIQWPWHEGNNQRWQLTVIGSG